MITKHGTKGGAIVAAAVVALIVAVQAHAIGQSLAHTQYEIGELIYENALSSEADLDGAVIESSEEDQPVITFDNGRMRMESDVHFLLWFPDDLPDNIAVTWEFLPEVDDGLAMFWFCAKGREGEDLFDPSLDERTGSYSQYNRGDINAYHLAYFRRNPWDDPHLNTVNLRKSYGHELVALGANPIPAVEHVEDLYTIQVIKSGPNIQVSINDIVVVDWYDEDEYWEEGKIGFRQMANLAAEYANLRVNEVSRIED